MSTLPTNANSIVYAQFNIQGRWPRLLSVAIGYGIVLGAIIWVTAITVSPDLRGWILGLCGLQTMNLLVFGAFRVESAVRGDVSSRMLESHRLMPAPPLGSILGYIFGAPLQSLLVAAVNFGLGAICCASSGVSLQAWAMANGALLLFAILSYSIIAQLAFVTRGGFLLLLIGGIMLLGIGENDGLIALPALLVLLNPLVSRSSVFAELVGGFRAQHTLEGYLTAFIAQAALLSIFIRAGVRRYVSTTLAGISQRLGLLLLAMWVGMILICNTWPEYFEFRSRFYYSSSDQAMITVMGFGTSMLIALLPIGSAAWTARQAQRSGQRSMGHPRIAASEVATLLTAAALVLALLIDIPARPGNSSSRGQLTAVIIVNFLASMGYLFSWGYLIRKRAWIFVIIWLMITWLVPVAADAVYRSLNDDNTPATFITAFSPPGALALIWSNSLVTVIPGVVGQLALTGMPVAILLFTQNRRRRKPIRT